ncbi:MAG: TrkH family potassium uptake protein [Clostridia bacterium]|nr:TrkH family potassium uptake protein [Clostridia bacterium]
MNRKMVLNIIGKIVLTEAILMLLPLLTAVIYGETTAMFAFLITIGVAVAVGGLFMAVSRTRDTAIYAGEGFVIVAFAWLIMSLIGCLPFVISKEIPNFFNAFFETVSGFTTTGASVLVDVEALSNSMLFWRSFTHWVGGMGVLVFVMAIIPSTKGSMNIMRAEMPGPVIGKLVPRLRDTAKLLYIIYMVLTLLETVLLCFGEMSFFESLLHSFGTAGTGGFGIKGDSVAGYSPYSQWVITIFMLIFGINFNLYYFILVRRAKEAIKSTELWVYFGIVAATVTIITVNISNLYSSFSEAIRHSAFQVASIISTTGYGTTDFNAWPGICRAVIFILMFTGACAGSTAGGLKLSRVILLFKTVGREIRQMLHPRSVNKVRFEGKITEENTLRSVATYFAIYMICIVAGFILISFEPFSLETNLTAAVSCFNNIRPGLDAVGPASNYSAYTGFTKMVLSFAMLFGRLEIFPLIIAFSPSTWMRKYR